MNLQPTGELHHTRTQRRIDPWRYLPLVGDDGKRAKTSPEAESPSVGEEGIVEGYLLLLVLQ